MQTKCIPNSNSRADPKMPPVTPTPTDSRNGVMEENPGRKGL